MDSSLLFLPELLLVASIMAIPALYIATENNKSYSICANMTLALSLYYSGFIRMKFHLKRIRQFILFIAILNWIPSHNYSK